MGGLRIVILASTKSPLLAQSIQYILGFLTLWGKIDVLQGRQGEMLDAALNNSLQQQGIEILAV